MYIIYIYTIYVYIICTRIFTCWEGCEASHRPAPRPARAHGRGGVAEPRGPVHRPGAALRLRTLRGFGSEVLGVQVGGGYSPRFRTQRYFLSLKARPVFCPAASHVLFRNRGRNGPDAFFHSSDPMRVSPAGSHVLFENRKGDVLSGFLGNPKSVPLIHLLK